eukprot:7265310-Heterocapsa_arctica.AAC.1
MIMGHRLHPTIKFSVILTPNIDIRMKRHGRSASKSEILATAARGLSSKQEKIIKRGIMRQE